MVLTVTVIMSNDKQTLYSDNIPICRKTTLIMLLYMDISYRGHV